MFAMSLISLLLIVLFVVWYLTVKLDDIIADQQWHLMKNRFGYGMAGMWPTVDQLLELDRRDRRVK